MLVALVIAEKNDENLVKLAIDGGIPFCFYGNDITEIQEFLNLVGMHHWLVNAWSGHKIPKVILDMFMHRINIHPSYAPYCLGSDSAAWAIMESRRECEFGLERKLKDTQFFSGCCLLEMTDAIDRGKIYARKRIICDFGITGKELQSKLVFECIELFKEKFPDYYFLGVRKYETIENKVISLHTRKQTNKARCINGDDVMRVKDFITNCLANDFSPLHTTLIDIGDERYKITVNLERTERT